ncbi:MAG TPA: hypothetical protein VK497_04380 [Candidatus Saccharimonadales bacterium]|nr:hypothetical protein [Candidatus Saccharimonadales bacterium]
MTYEEKGKWIYLATTVLGFVVYVGVILNRAQDMAITEVPYISTILWIIGIALVVTILGQIAIAIAKPSEADKKDERDKDINRKGDFVGGIVLGVAMIVPFGLTMAEFDHFWIANAMYSAFVLSAIISTMVKIVAYRRGL